MTGKDTDREIDWNKDCQMTSQGKPQKATEIVVFVFWGFLEVAFFLTITYSGNPSFHFKIKLHVQHIY